MLEAFFLFLLPYSDFQKISRSSLSGHGIYCIFTVDSYPTGLLFSPFPGSTFSTFSTYLNPHIQGNKLLQKKWFNYREEAKYDHVYELCISHGCACLVFNNRPQSSTQRSEAGKIVQEKIELGCMNKAKNGEVLIINMFAIIQNFQTHFSITHRFGIDC